MNNKKYYGLAIDTSDSRPGIVAWQSFVTEAEAKAYAWGVNAAAECADYESMHGDVSTEEPEDE